VVLGLLPVGVDFFTNKSPEMRERVKELARSTDWRAATLAASKNRARISIAHRSKKAVVAPGSACLRTEPGAWHKAAMLRPVRGARRIGEDELRQSLAPFCRAHHAPREPEGGVNVSMRLVPTSPLPNG